ncbi:MAG: diguanylate cyclase [Ruminococcaceae bacterium]|nr:diguanylate cyclase [Oscillospiraceae bacterium]
MSIKSKLKPKDGVSLRTIHLLLVIGAFVLSGLMLFSATYLSISFKNLTENSQKYFELKNACLELNDASDYMTERVQRFAVTGNKQCLQEYYNEAFLIKHRDEAVETLSKGTESTEALESLENAMNVSKQLMNREYYAIKLVVEANNIEEYPLPLDDVELSERDAALSAEEKRNRAIDIVFDNDYYSQKALIHDSMHESLNELERLVNESEKKALNNMRGMLTFLSVMIIITTVAVFFLVWLASRLGINPIIKAVDKIKSGNKIPEGGTTEFRYLVRAYNQMYDMYKKSLEKLDFKASHDELTGVYNRTGYESLLSSIDFSSTYMLLFDVDNFKEINDTYGHETGDKVLQKLARTLKNYFREDDFICRIGGDEFIVLMLHTPEKQQELIAKKINSINEKLKKTDDGLPSTSLSVGIVHGSEGEELDELFKKTDVAMYESKRNGKGKYTFYSTNLNSKA